MILGKNRRFIMVIILLSTSAISLGMYQPETGRFIQQDPIGVRDGICIIEFEHTGSPYFPSDLYVFGQYFDGMSLYHYIANNPILFVDPFGTYQEDVHRRLTEYLAKAAGFNDTCKGLTPEVIGNETQLVDEDERGPWAKKKFGIPLPANIDIHFATEAQLENHMNKAFKTCNPHYIGTYLHSLEDTFSHQPGETDRDQWDLPPKKRRNWHGRQGHKPDHTWRRPELADLMAGTVYDILKKLAKECCTCPAQPREYQDLINPIKYFNREKDEKKKIDNLQ